MATYIFKTNFTIDPAYAKPDVVDTQCVITITGKWRPNSTMCKVLRLPYNDIDIIPVPMSDKILTEYEDLDDILDYIDNNNLYDGTLMLTDTSTFYPKINEPSPATLAEWKHFLVDFHLVLKSVPKPFKQENIYIQYKTPAITYNLFHLQISSYNWYTYSIRVPKTIKTYGNENVSRISVYNLEAIHNKIADTIADVSECIKHNYLNLKLLSRINQQTVTKILNRVQDNLLLRRFNVVAIAETLLLSETIAEFRKKMEKKGYNRAIVSTALYALLVAANAELNEIINEEEDAILIFTLRSIADTIQEVPFVTHYGQRVIKDNMLEGNPSMIVLHQLIGTNIVPVVNHIVYSLTLPQKSVTEQLLSKGDRIFAITHKMLTDNLYREAYETITDYLLNEARLIAKYGDAIREDYELLASSEENGIYIMLKTSYAIAAIYQTTDLKSDIEKLRCNFIDTVCILNGSAPVFVSSHKLSIKEIEEMMNKKVTTEKKQMVLKRVFDRDQIFHSIYVPLSTEQCVFQKPKLYDLCSFAENGSYFSELLGFNLQRVFVDSNTSFTLDSVKECLHSVNFTSEKTTRECIPYYNHLYGRDPFNTVTIEIKNTIANKKFNFPVDNRRLNTMWYITNDRDVRKLRNTNVLVFRETTLQLPDSRIVCGSWFSAYDTISTKQPTLLLVQCRNNHLHHAIAKASFSKPNEITITNECTGYDRIDDKVFWSHVELHTPYWLVINKKRLEMTLVNNQYRIFKYDRQMKRKINMVVLHGLYIWNDIVLKVDSKDNIPSELAVEMFVHRRNGVKNYIESTKNAREYRPILVSYERNNKTYYLNKVDLYSGDWHSTEFKGNIKLTDLINITNIIVVYKKQNNTKLHLGTF